MENNSDQGLISKLQKFSGNKRIIISRFGGFALVCILIFTYKPWQLSTTSYFLIKFISLLLIAFCITGRIWALLYICGKKTRSLITHGPYSAVRHPLYFFSFFGALGIGLSSLNFFVLACILGFFGLYYPFVIMAEERKMIATHGDEYIQYMARVPRFLPAFGHYTDIGSVEIQPKRFRRDLLSAMYFLGMYLFFEILQYLYAVHILPVVF
jgi:protein-S-isoprenylcysteine O-methyltransferase Ste14